MRYLIAWLCLCATISAQDPREVKVSVLDPPNAERDDASNSGSEYLIAAADLAPSGIAVATSAQDVEALPYEWISTTYVRTRNDEANANATVTEPLTPLVANPGWRYQFDADFFAEPPEDDDTYTFELWVYFDDDNWLFIRWDALEGGYRYDYSYHHFAFGPILVQQQHLDSYTIEEWYFDAILTSTPWVYHSADLARCDANGDPGVFSRCRVWCNGKTPTAPPPE